MINSVIENQTIINTLCRDSSTLGEVVRAVITGVSSVRYPKFGISRSLIGDEERSGGIKSLINPNKAIIRSSFAFDLRKKNRIPIKITKYTEF